MAEDDKLISEIKEAEGVFSKGKDPESKKLLFFILLLFL